MHFRSRVSTSTIHERLFADDCALNATTEEEMQMRRDLFAATSHINVNGTQLKSVDTFMYLGNNLTRSTKVDDEITYRIAKSQPSLWTHAELGLESTLSAPKHQTQDLQSCHIADADGHTADVDGKTKAGIEAQPLPPQPLSQNT
ncbi:unnamed protein product [Schistocephalus solidus]|uniref:Reverse transcriptase domain-containing protein n=1 Tax=Schistocephalus solidus TaxID=70667 RepID=A0A183TRC2_SCHSO|nr:unnamed protein product [Schistocephalus solidus]